MSQAKNSRMERTCNRALLESIDAFPTLLARCEPEQAATIVSSLLKFMMVQNVKEVSPLQEFERIMNQIRREGFDE